MCNMEINSKSLLINKPFKKFTIVVVLFTYSFMMATCFQMEIKIIIIFIDIVRIRKFDTTNKTVGR